MKKRNCNANASIHIVILILCKFQKQHADYKNMTNYNNASRHCLFVVSLGLILVAGIPRARL